ncbi:MAG TPA: hypothetical protein VIO15_09205, partial [Bacteroidales bacterium]
VVRQNYSTKDVVHLINELAENDQLPHLNVLINDVKIPGYYGYTSHYGGKYGYKYHYGYSYSDYSYSKGYYSDDDDTPVTFKERLKRWIGL